MTITVSNINIFPVKSLRGISLTECVLTSRGLANDRRFLLVDDDDDFITQREHPLMATIATAIDGGQLVFTSAFGDQVVVPLAPSPAQTRKVVVWNSVVDAHAVSKEADAFFSEHLGASTRLVYMPDSSERRCNAEYAKNNEIVSFADGYPVLIANEASLDDLNTRIVANGGAAVGMGRFRANIVVAGSTPWTEDGWRDIRVGSTQLRFAKPCGRCQVTTTDQTTGQVRGPEPLATLSQFRDSPFGVRFGINVVPVSLGEVRLGDRLMTE